MRNSFTIPILSLYRILINSCYSTLMHFFKDYSLSIVLFCLFLLSWLGQLNFQWQEFVISQQEHFQPAKMEDFLPEFASRTFENWQSEFLQLFAMVVLTSFLIHKGSHESRDNDDQVNRKLNEIQRAIRKLQGIKTNRIKQ